MEAVGKAFGVMKGRSGPEAPNPQALNRETRSPRHYSVKPKALGFRV